jgi:hypothetical protein
MRDSSEARRAAVPRPALAILLLLNAVVLLGQIWPAGAPPFARAVNILFLVLTLGVFGRLWLRPGG